MLNDLKLKDNPLRLGYVHIEGVKRPLLLYYAKTNFESRIFFKCKSDHFTTFLTIQ